jgi:hypothetical protein
MMLQSRGNARVFRF